jgi:hypothetical protein
MCKISIPSRLSIPFDSLQRDSNLLNMPPKRRLPSSDAANPPPPRKSARLVTKAPSDDDSSGPSKTLTPRSNDNDSPGPSKKSQKDTSQGKTLSDPALVQEVRKMAENKAKAEIMILELMRKYSFDLSELQKLLNRKANQPQVA